jgi:hypothetical protein
MNARASRTLWNVKSARMQEGGLNTLRPENGSGYDQVGAMVRLVCMLLVCGTSFISTE